ncbi:hypothetical protein HWI79_2813 [Cryptosporidium felis]|nr:hypothetical protein HWI79_2813 [Cryptosporidium felis]
MKTGLRSIFFWILMLEGSLGWLLNFDIVPSSVIEDSNIPLRSCKVNYWTQFNTECMDGCSIPGELRYGPNYLSGEIPTEFPKSIGINCRVKRNGQLWRGIHIESFWIKADLCVDPLESLVEIIAIELENQPRKSIKHIIFTENVKSQEHSSSIYIGAYYMSSIGDILRKKRSLNRYIRYSFIVDAFLVILLILNSIILKYRLFKLKVSENLQS